VSDARLFANGQLRLIGAGPVVTLELNQPEKHNAVSSAMWQALPEAVAAIEADDAIRVVLVRGAGGRAFSAGADISEFAHIYSDPGRTETYNAAVRAAQAALRHLDRPVIAVIDGVCVGGGCGIALACDLRFASSAARFAITPARLGLAYSYADTAQLVEKVGPARAKDILFSGRMLPAEEALAIGLIDRMIAPDELNGVVRAYAQDLALLSQTSIRAAKSIVNMLVDDGAATPDKAARIADASFSGPDFHEGFQAFVEKRKPNFG
jgi:enoyl-CoA hydratase/carnithine racemase